MTRSVTVKGFIYSQVPEDLIYDHRLSPLDVRVWACLARHGFDPSSCFPSHERIAALVDCSVRSVRRAVENLATCGWLECERSCRVDGGWGVNHYTLLTETPIGHTRPVVPDRGGQTHRTEVADEREQEKESHLTTPPEAELFAEVRPISTAKKEIQKQELEDEFSEWWDGIWRKERKQSAKNHYLRIRSKGLATREHLFLQRDAYAKLMRARRREQEHTRMPANWLAEGDWDEEIPVEKEQDPFTGPEMRFG